MSLFVGSIYPKSLFDKLVERKLFVDYPANVFQQTLLKGLDLQYPDIRVITSPVIKSKYSLVNDICGECIFTHNGSSPFKDICVGVVPIPGLQMLIELVRVFKALKSEINKSNRKEVLFIYALHSPFLLSAVLLKRKTTCTCVIVPDLPEYMASNKGILRKIGKRIDHTIIDFCLKRLDCFVLLSEYMRDRLPIKNKPWVLVEGLYDTTNILEFSEKNPERVIFYGGSLSKSYGILELLEAFKRIKNNNYRLWICGDGDGKADVIKRANEDKRIVYFGVISHDEVLSLLQKATVLINPRSSSGEYTKYSFPSKTMEYMASGTPTLMCHLPAIPKDYDDYLFYIADESVDGIKKRIVEVCEMPQHILKEFGHKASVFIKEEKNVFAQTERIADMIANIGTC